MPGLQSAPGCREGKEQERLGPHTSLPLSWPVCPMLALAGRGSLWAPSPHCGKDNPWPYIERRLWGFWSLVSPPLSLPMRYLWETGAKYPTLVKRTSMVWPLRTLHRAWLQQHPCVVGKGGKGACWLGIHFKKNSLQYPYFRLEGDFRMQRAQKI